MLQETPIPCHRYHAQCLECDWNDTITVDVDEQELKTRVIQHVKEHNHMVLTEKVNNIVHSIK